jgi:cysteine synthase A
MIPDILQHAKIDEVVHVEEADTVDHCIDMLKKNFLFLGGSSGSVIAGLNKYFTTNPLKKKANVLVLFPDGGEKYINTVYNNDWCVKCFGHTPRPI